MSKTTKQNITITIDETALLYSIGAIADLTVQLKNEGERCLIANDLDAYKIAAQREKKYEDIYYALVLAHYRGCKEE